MANKIEKKIEDFKGITLEGRSDEVNVSKNKKEVEDIVSKIKAKLKEDDKLLALSAPQLGFSRRIFCLKFSDSDIKTFINPMVTAADGVHISREIDYETKKEYLIPRNNEINICYQTLSGNAEQNKLLGAACDYFLQQIDYLDGVSIADIGLEVIPEFDEATDEEKNEVIAMYLKSLSEEADKLNAEIEKDEELNKIAKAIKFLTEKQIYTEKKKAEKSKKAEKKPLLH